MSRLQQVCAVSLICSKIVITIDKNIDEGSHVAEYSKLVMSRLQQVCAVCLMTSEIAMAVV